MSKSNCFKCQTTDNDGFGNDLIGCGTCKNWFHAVTCEKLSPKNLVMWKNNGEYTCLTCNNDSGASATAPLDHSNDDKFSQILAALGDLKIIKDDVVDIKQKFNLLRNDVNTIKNDVDTVKIDLTDVQSKIAILESNLCFKDQADFKNTVLDILDSKAADTHADHYQISKRRKRIIITKIPPGTVDDKAFVKSLAEEIGPDYDTEKIRSIRRIPKKNNSGFMLNVEFKFEYDKFYFIDGKLATKLKSLDSAHHHHGIICHQDHSVKQIQLYNKLKIECAKKNAELVMEGVLDWEFRIIDYQIVKRPKSTPSRPQPQSSPTSSPITTPVQT